MKSRYYIALLAAFVLVMTACGTSENAVFQEVNEGEKPDHMIGTYTYELAEGYTEVQPTPVVGNDNMPFPYGYTSKQYSKTDDTGSEQVVKVDIFPDPTYQTVDYTDEEVYEYLESLTFLEPDQQPLPNPDRTTVNDQPAITFTEGENGVGKLGQFLYIDGMIISYVLEEGDVEQGKQDMQDFFDSIKTIDEKIEDDPPLMVKNQTIDSNGLTIVYPEFLNFISTSIEDEFSFNGTLSTGESSWSLIITRAPEEYLDKIEGDDTNSKTNAALQLILDDAVNNSGNHYEIPTTVEEIEVKEMKYDNVLIKYAQFPYNFRMFTDEESSKFDMRLYTFERDGIMYFAGAVFNPEQNGFVIPLMDYIFDQTFNGNN